MYYDLILESSRVNRMVSTPYARGRNREYQALRQLREEGWFCTRSAASHGPVDILAGKKGEILMVQVKSGSARATAVERELLKRWGKAFRGKVEIWKFRKGRPLERETVYEHPREQVNRDSQKIHGRDPAARPSIALCQVSRRDEEPLRHP
jgi:Holliday junction resolvase